MIKDNHTARYKQKYDNTYWPIYEGLDTIRNEYILNNTTGDFFSIGNPNANCLVSTREIVSKSNN